MKPTITLIILAILLSLTRPAEGATVIFQFQDNYGRAATPAVSLTPLSVPLIQSNTIVLSGLTTFRWPTNQTVSGLFIGWTNGQLVLPLSAGGYTVQVSSWPRAWSLTVPVSTNTFYAADLSSNTLILGPQTIMNNGTGTGGGSLSNAIPTNAPGVFVVNGIIVISTNYDALGAAAAVQAAIQAQFNSLTNGFVDRSVTNSALNRLAQNDGSQLINLNIPAGCTLWVDQVNGNDSTGARGNAAKPFLHITNAVAAAQPGDLVYVRAGLYPEHEILKPGVNYHGDPGANIQYIQTTTNEDGHGIFDDFAGASTNCIDWQGTLEYDGLTNIVVMSNYWAAFPNAAQNFIYPNAAGIGGSLLFSPVAVTNPATRLIGHVTRLRVGNMMSNGGGVGALFFNGNNCHLDVSLIENAFLNDPGYTITDYDGFGDDWTFGATGVFGVYWAFGNLYMHVDDNEGNLNAIWCDEPPPRATSENDFYYDGDIIDSSIYTTAVSYNEVGWFNIKRAKAGLAGSPANANELEFFGSGKWYLNLQKVDTAKNTASTVFMTPANGTSNALVWIDAEKFTASNGAAWFNQQIGTLWARVSHLEDIGGAAPSLFTGNAEAHIDGLTATMGARKMFTRVGTFGQPVEFKNFTMTDTNGECVYLQTNGISFSNVKMITFSNAPCIGASSPQNITYLGGSVTNIWTNSVTVTGYLETTGTFYSH